MNAVRVFGLIPAAGVSRRMGQAKQLLPWTGGTILESVIAALRAAPLDGLAVATNPAVATQLGLDEKWEAGDLASVGPEVTLVLVDGARTEMIDSIVCAVERLEGRFKTTAEDGFLVVPGDMPALRTSAVSACVHAYRAAPGRIAVAQVHGKNAHPIVVPFALAERLPTLRGVGLKGLLTALRETINPVPLPADSGQSDIDDPEDYQAARTSNGNG